MKRKAGYLILIIVISLPAWVFVESRSRSSVSGHSDSLSATALPRSFEITVRTVGELDAGSSHIISSAVKGDKGKIIFLINDGSGVEKDEVLVRLESTPFEEEIARFEEEVIGLESAAVVAEQLSEWEKNQAEREIRSAEFNLQIARLEYQKLTDGDAPLQAALYKEETERAKEEYERYAAYISDLESLSEQGFSIANELKLAKKKSLELKEKYASSETKNTSYQKHVLPSQKALAKAKTEKAETELEQIKKGSVFKIAKASADVTKTKDKLRSARNNLSMAKEELEKSVIRAPFSGIAILYEAFRDGQQRKPRIGDRVWQNQPLLYLPDISSMIVNTQVRETDLHHIAAGQKCIIRVDAYPNTVFEGSIRFIGMLAVGKFNENTGEKFFRITSAVNGENSVLRPGMTARVAIVTDRLQDALTVPVHSVFREGEHCYCYKDTGGNRFQKVAVTLGRVSEDFAEILSGLEKGDRVSLISREDKR